MMATTAEDLEANTRIVYLSKVYRVVKVWPPENGRYAIDLQAMTVGYTDRSITVGANYTFQMV